MREAPGEVNPRMLTSSQTVQCIKWSLELEDAFRGFSNLLFWVKVSWSELPLNCLYMQRESEWEPWPRVFKVRGHNRVICWNFPILLICAYPVGRKCFLMSSQITSIAGCCNPPTPKKHSASVQLSIKHRWCDKFCQSGVSLFRKASQQGCKHSFSPICQALVDVWFDPACVAP